MERIWFVRLEAEHRAGNVTRGEWLVLKELGRMLAMGDDRPSEARLVSESGCSRRTVQRAKVRARELGLLGWETRHQREGGRIRRLPCLYRAEMPAHAAASVKRQGGAGRFQERKMLRSVRAQLAALPTPTPWHLALWEARKARRWDQSCHQRQSAR